MRCKKVPFPPGKGDLSMLTERFCTALATAAHAALAVLVTGAGREIRFASLVLAVGRKFGNGLLVEFKLDRDLFFHVPKFNNE